MPDRPRILVVEDDLHVVQGLVRGLAGAGFEPTVVMSGDGALERILGEPFDLVLLDLMLPGRTGLEILEGLRSRSSVPVVVLSARSDLPARLESFAQGAVDFVPKPFFLAELVARIRARLALSAPAPRRALPLADVVVDLDARSVTRDGQGLGLTAHEFNVLACLRERAGRALTRAQIAESALSETGGSSARTVDSHVSRLRKKLGPEAAACIRTVWGIGYSCTLPGT